MDKHIRMDFTTVVSTQISSVFHVSMMNLNPKAI
jgi:hypothetical protein